MSSLWGNLLKGWRSNVQAAKAQVAAQQAAKEAVVPKAPTKFQLFPSPPFLARVTESNISWLDQCLERPLVHPKTGVRVHLLGVSLLNRPPPTYPSFSVEAFASLHPSPSTILIDESGPFETYPAALELSGLNPTRDPLDWRTWALQNFDGLEKTDIPPSWLSALVATGLRPGWDVLSLLSKKEPLAQFAAGNDPAIRFVGMSGEEDQQKIEEFLATEATEEFYESIVRPEGVAAMAHEQAAQFRAGQSSLFADHLEERVVDSQADELHLALRDLFSAYQIEPTDLSRISTGFSMADNKIQKLPLSPPALAAYHQIVAKHLLAMKRTEPSDTTQRWERAEAGRAVRQRHLAKQIRDAAEKGGEGEVMLAVIDRSHDEGVRQLWDEHFLSNGEECE
ncbi:hypothetical protein HK097_003674 [Rhizophlyctis rosea]|uniref:Uncharacterized protein n=1 Tax=Rhizophlyctis rosea TaxID=64517 RepID=A0AAD5X0G6_9FUNG|nr:hypothetical protein HK097_003674 [Rhizophlyctis rosea]